MRAALTGSLLAVWAVLAALGAMEAVALVSGSRVPPETVRLALACGAVAALAGAPVGVMAPRLRGGAAKRLPTLAAAIGVSYVAANLVVAFVAAVAAAAIRGSLVHGASAALVVLYGAGILVAPALAIPLLLAGAALEAFTRPAPATAGRDRARTIAWVKGAMALVAATAVGLAVLDALR